MGLLPSDCKTKVIFVSVTFLIKINKADRMKD